MVEASCSQEVLITLEKWYGVKDIESYFIYLQSIKRSSLAWRWTCMEMEKILTRLNRLLKN